MATQTGDMKRVCEAHKIILHSKVRNRLKNDTVHKLYYCYINLWLRKKLEQHGKFDMGDILEDFLSQGISENADDSDGRIINEFLMLTLCLFLQKKKSKYNPTAGHHVPRSIVLPREELPFRRPNGPS
jgi:hypothetical protein